MVTPTVGRGKSFQDRSEVQSDPPELGPDGRLLREDIVEKPLIMVPDDAMKILYGRYVPPHFDYVGEASRRVV